MVNPIDDIARQARQGSVAAIIQVLNEKLADSGVRTRAVLDKGVLQLLCEAHQVEQLEQSVLVEEIRQILESLAPRYIRRVKINSRLVREQQLLWLEEISRDPERELLWFQEIILKKPNFLIRLVEDWKSDKQVPGKRHLATQISSSPFEREQRQFRRGILVGGVGLSVVVLFVALVLQNSLGVKVSPSNQLVKNSPSPAGSTMEAKAKSASKDVFAEAVRLAEQNSAAGKVAASRDDWLSIAAKWQQASALMGSVPPNHPRYQIAQNRSALYREYSAKAQEEADKRL